MESTSVHGLLEQLDDNIEDLDQALAPLIQTSLSDTASKLPLLDKAKLYVLATYSIESLLFSYIRLNNVDAKSHPVFRELARVKQYFEKIQTAETGGQRRQNLTLAKEAAGRFIKHALAEKKDPSGEPKDLETSQAVPVDEGAAGKAAAPKKRKRMDAGAEQSAQGTSSSAESGTSPADSTSEQASGAPSIAATDQQGAEQPVTKDVEGGSARPRKQLSKSTRNGIKKAVDPEGFAVLKKQKKRGRKAKKRRQKEEAEAKAEMGEGTGGG